MSIKKLFAILFANFFFLILTPFNVNAKINNFEFSNEGISVSDTSLMEWKGTGRILANDDNTAFVVWYNNVNGFIYANKFDFHGNKLWSSDLLLSDSGDDSMVGLGEDLISDGVGGAYYIWDSWRPNPTDPTDYFPCIIIVRFTADGNISPGWSAGGVNVIFYDYESKYYERATLTSEGNVIVTWYDERDGDYAIYAQKISPEGNLLWNSEGILLSNKADGNWRGNPRIVADDSDGAFITWIDTNPDPDYFEETRGQRIDGDGNILWGNGGKHLIWGSSWDEFHYRSTISDGENGIYVTGWGGTSTNETSILRINSVGDPYTDWPTEGLKITGKRNGGGEYLDIDSNNGLIVAGEGDDDIIFAHRVLPNGTFDPDWPINGYEVFSNSEYSIGFENMKIVGDQVFIFWRRLVAPGDQDLYLSVINTDGNPDENWLNPSVLTVQPGRQFDVNISVDNNDNMWLQWLDQRSGQREVYIQLGITSQGNEAELEGTQNNTETNDPNLTETGKSIIAIFIIGIFALIIIINKTKLKISINQYR